jgi:hypothetical protein
MKCIIGLLATAGILVFPHGHLHASDDSPRAPKEFRMTLEEMHQRAVLLGLSEDKPPSFLSPEYSPYVDVIATPDSYEYVEFGLSRSIPRQRVRHGIRYVYWPAQQRLLGERYERGEILECETVDLRNPSANYTCQVKDYEVTIIRLLCLPNGEKVRDGLSVCFTTDGFCSAFYDRNHIFSSFRCGSLFTLGRNGKGFVGTLSDEENQLHIIERD